MSVIGGSPPFVAVVKLLVKVELPMNVKFPPVLSLVVAEKDTISNSNSVAAKLMVHTIATPITECTMALSATTSNDVAVLVTMIRVLGLKRSGGSSVFAPPK
jgi:hypothetical protein